MSHRPRRAHAGWAAVRTWSLWSASAALAVAAVAGTALLPRTHAAENLRLLTQALTPAITQAGQTPVADPQQTGFVTLRGNTRREAMPGNDLGRVADDFPLDHLMLQLRRTPEREQALEQFIQELHDPASPHFHHWLSAAEFGRRFGPSAEQVAQVSAWLGSMGILVHLVYPSQMLIDFSGSAGQVAQTFHTEIHSLRVNGRRHFANISDPQIPAALASTMAGVVSMNDFMPQRMLAARSDYTAGGDSYPVVPADLWTIYGFNPMFAAGYSGQGQTIVVIEDTDLYSTQDWTDFRGVLGLSAGYPAGSLTEIHPQSYPANNCSDPGVNADDLEAAVDAEWASAAAPNAAIELASCQSIAVWGGFVALQNLLNQPGAPPAIVSISYGESESLLGAAYNAYINSLYQQAAAEGVSVFVSSGDEGAAASDYDAPFAQGGINVSGLTSTPYNVSVGGTDFADTYQSTNSTYWNSANAANFGSALSYIPEIPWNDSCAGVLRSDYLGLLPTYGANSLCDKSSPNTIAAGGGPSGCATGAPDADGIGGGTCAGYAKPWWQSPLTGNPSDGVRDIPDLALFASNNSWGHAYVVCYSDPNYGGEDCSGAPATWFSAGGTSFAAPIMAAIQSLINQASGSRWGNPDPAYYSLAAAQFAGGAACDSALGKSLGSNCIFHDVIPIPLLYTGTGTGGDIDVPCLGVNCRLPAGSYGVLSTAPQALNMVEVTSQGSGYTTSPACSLSGGGGTGAACQARLTGQVASLVLTNPGSGYVPAGTTCTLAGGGGTGAACVASIYGTGQIAGVILTSPGSGYTSAPTCTISGGGAGAACAATEQLGLVVSLTAGGSGYTTMPQCVLSGGGGTGAACAALAINASSAYQPAFTAAPQWDFATGLGSVNVANLAAAFLSSSASISPLDLVFQPQIPGISSASQAITVTNTGTVAFTLLAVTVGGANPGDFAKSSDTCTGAALSPQNSCMIGVGFTPTAVGDRSASLNIGGLFPQTSQFVALSGVGIGAGAVLSPQTVTFAGQVVGSIATQTINLTNPGNVPLTLGAIAISGSNDFGETNTCSAMLAAGSTCSISVTFAPSAPGSATAAITVTGSGLNGPQTITLAGTGAVPIPFVNPTLTPASVAPGGEAFTLRVTGTGFARGASVQWNGAALSTTYLSSEEVAASVPAGAIATPGTARVGVANPGAGMNSNLVLFSVSPPAPTAAFAPAGGSSIAVGIFPLPMVVADFNGDGRSDIAVLNENSQSVTILLGKGDGTFTPAAGSPATGMNPSAIAAGDFNGDGMLDLAITNLGNDNLTILLGNGDGTFRAAASPATGGQPVAVATGDLNSDGKLDLAVVNQGSYNVTILLGNGDGTFSPASASADTGAVPEAITVGDFNGDGKLDLAVTNSANSNVSILLGNGDGTFTSAAAAPATGPSPYAIAAGDFNGDGKLDLAVVNQGDCGLTILLGNGDGTFTPAAASAVPPGISNYSIAVADFNADGKPDLAVANNGSGQATILLGNGDGTFAPTASPPVTGANPWGVAAGDFNGDGRIDLVTANSGSNSVSVMLQSPQGPAAAVSPGSLTFSSQSVGTASSSQTILLSNSGSAALNVTAITASGNFSQTNNCPDSLPAGGSCTILVTFAPSATGALSGMLTITDNNDGLTGSSQTAMLAGTGTAPVTASPAPVVLPSAPASVLPLQSGR